MKSVAFIGVGDISGIYLENLTNRFRNLKIAGICDLVPEKAQRASEKYGGLRIYKDMFEAFDDPSVDIILNITRPYQHYEVSRQALLHGKHVYSEKPLAPTIEEGQALVALAQEKGLLLGGAPDTFLGAGYQTCRKLIDDGFIGDIVGATAFMMGQGPESWHPDPFFFYQFAGGPMMDMGPYYVTALISLLGPVESVMGMNRTPRTRRTATCAAHYGEPIDVEVPTHVSGLLQFKNGPTATLVTSFDVPCSERRNIEIYGTKGTLFAPDPNNFGDPVRLYRQEDGAIREMPLLFDHRENSRGLGLSRMAEAIDGKDEFRNSCALTYHALDVMTGIIRSGETGKRIEMTTAPERPAAMEG